MALVTEEVEVGMVQSGPKVVQGVDAGTYQVVTPSKVESTPVSVESTPVSSPSLATAITSAPSNLPVTLEDLQKVSSVVNNSTSCNTVEDIASQIGLTNDKVIMCLEYLVGQQLVSKDAARYCGMSAVKSMMKQLKTCVECKG